MQASLQRDWTWSYWHHGELVIGKHKVFGPIGKVYNEEKPWPVSTYTVDLYVAGIMIASGSFEITDGQSPTRDSSSSPVGDSDEKAADAAHKEAVGLTKTGKYREAIPHLDKAIRLNPGLIDAYLVRGQSNAILSSGESKPEYERRAIADYTTAIQKGLKVGVRNSGWYAARGVSYS
jgi:tetratricopeptide (TPR) repeat protein